MITKLKIFEQQVPPDITKKVISASQLTDLLKNIGKDKTFISYANKYGSKNYIVEIFDEEYLTHGFCNPLSYYIKDRYAGISVYSAKNDVDGNHLFLKFEDKYYDAKNIYGVNKPEELDFFTSKNIKIKLLEKY